MILDSIKNIERYRSLSVNMAKAIDFIATGKITTLQAGKFEIDGDNIFVLMNEYESRPKEDCKTETHRKYIDIQWMIEGEEKVGYSFLENQKIVDEYNPEKDCTFYNAQLDYFELKQQWFAIFFPTDLHCPSIKINESIPIRKAVIKVKVD